MATYKVIQDIEAEDKLLGPFTLRQFVYAIIVIVCLFLGFQFGKVQPFLAIIFVPPAAFFTLLAAPFGHDQSSEVWLLAKIRFSLKPRKRIWDQSGMQELVTITVPKKIERHLTDGLNPYEVKSRLSALANTLDSRGWAVKNVNVNLFSPPSYLLGQDTTDRLINPSSLPQDVPGYGNTAFDVVLDETTSPTAQHFNAMIGQAQQSQRQRLMQEMQQNGGNPSSPKPADYWFMNQAPQPTDPGMAAFTKTNVVTPGMVNGQLAGAQPTPEEQAILDKLHEEENHPVTAYGHLRTIEPLDSKHRSKKSKQQAKQSPALPMTPAPDPAIMQLANNDDLNVATIARQANKVRPVRSSPDEVVISLH